MLVLIQHVLLKQPLFANNLCACVCPLWTRFLTARLVASALGRTPRCLRCLSLPASSEYFCPPKIRWKSETLGGWFPVSSTSSLDTCPIIATTLPPHKAKRWCLKKKKFSCSVCLHCNFHFLFCVLMAVLFLLQVLIHSLLSMFHPRPFVKSRFAPQGTVACVRASSDFYYDIVFRWGGMNDLGVAFSHYCRFCNIFYLPWLSADCPENIPNVCLFGQAATASVKSNQRDWSSLQFVTFVMFKLESCASISSSSLPRVTYCFMELLTDFKVPVMSIFS